MTKQPKQKERKENNIEVVIHEMIDIVLEHGHTPFHIYLTEEDYNQLVERTGAFYPAGYEMVSDGVIYKSKPIPKRIEEYIGLPVYRGTETKIKWI